MDNIRSSFSRVKKDFKHRLRGKNREPDGTGTNVAGERVGSSDSRPEPRLAADDRDEESSRISTDGRQARLRDRFPQPEPVTAGRSHNDKRREADASGKEVSQRYSRLDPNAELAVDSRPSQGVGQAYPSPPSAAPDST